MMTPVPMWRSVVMTHSYYHSHILMLIFGSGESQILIFPDIIQKNKWTHQPFESEISAIVCRYTKSWLMGSVFLDDHSCDLSSRVPDRDDHNGDLGNSGYHRITVRPQAGWALQELEDRSTGQGAVRKRCFWCVMYSYAIICTLLHIYHIISLYKHYIYSTMQCIYIWYTLYSYIDVQIYVK